MAKVDELYALSTHIELHLLIRTMSDESLDLFEQEFWSEVEVSR